MYAEAPDVVQLDPEEEEEVPQKETLPEQMLALPVTAHVNLAQAKANPSAEKGSPSAGAIQPSGAPASMAPNPPPAPSSDTLFGLYHVPEDQVGASKEAMIQVTVMTKRLKDVYGASSALEANVRVSAIVSVFEL